MGHQIYSGNYGFVEPYPQRWQFEERLNIAFDLDTSKEDGSQSKLEVCWGPNPPTDTDIFFLQHQRERLEAFAVNLDSRPEDIPAFEWYHINTFLSRCDECNFARHFIRLESQSQF
jgi:hypothetical protein